MHHHTRHEREQLQLFRALPGDLAPRDAQDLMAYPFFSLAKTHRTTPIDFRMNEIAIRVEAVPEHGLATIWDADVLIWAAGGGSILAISTPTRRASRRSSTLHWGCATSRAASPCRATGSPSNARAAGASGSGDGGAAVLRPDQANERPHGRTPNSILRRRRG